MTDSANALRQSCAACRVQFKWFGFSRALHKSQKEQAASPFGANAAYLSAGKKILNRKNERVARLTEIRGQIVDYWKSRSLPYVEDGVRLLRKDAIEGFSERMNGFRTELQEAAFALQQELPAIQQQMQPELGDLYDATDYPHDIGRHFDVTWDFPNVEPPSYLAQLNPSVYAQEQAKVAARFAEAADMAQQAFIAEFAKLTTHLAERLKPDEDGKKQTFKDTSVNNLKEFFDRFKQLNVTGDATLNALVEQAKDTLDTVTGKDLRKSADLRTEVGAAMTQLSETLSGMIVPQQRRAWTQLQPAEGEAA